MEISSSQNRLPNLGKVSVAILESLVEPIIGKDAISELKAPVVDKDLREKLVELLVTTEKRFVAEFEDQELTKGIIDLSIANLPSIRNAVRIFYNNPADRFFQNLLEEKFAEDYPLVTRSRLHVAISFYLEILRQQLISISPDITTKLTALAVQDIQKNIQRIANYVDNEHHLPSKESLEAIRIGRLPPLPKLVIGRDEDIFSLKKRILAHGESGIGSQNMTIVRGWPGVGKTTITSVIAHDKDIHGKFSQGVLWVSLGQDPDLMAEMAKWGQILGDDNLINARSLEDAQSQLASLLIDKKMLLIVDDVWDLKHAILFNVGGQNCSTLFTTRLEEIAVALAPAAESIFNLRVLSNDMSLTLLARLTPSVVLEHPSECSQLVNDLEGLPLALQVAGRLLNAEHSHGFSVTELMYELREGARLLETSVPVDRIDLINETTPTIAALLYKSVEILDTFTRDCYIYLGAFAPKPATFSMIAMGSVWETKDPKPIAKTLIERGLLEYVSEIDRYQMHALLVMLAKSLMKQD